VTAAAKPTGIFRSAMSDVDGMVDAGYLGFLIFCFLTALVVVGMLAGLGFQAWADEHHKFDALQLGQGFGLAGSAFVGVAAAVGLFRRLDRPAASTSTSSTTTETTATSASK
jgi:membrane protein DedA with SNARE-associated domain